MLKKILHYYGDTVRRLFILAALVMILTLPFFVDDIGQPLIIPLVVILVVGVAAGLTSPRHPWSATMNVFLAAGGVLIFEWYAVDWYARYRVADNFFWTNQLLSVIFLLALYFSLKTIRRVGDMQIANGVKEQEQSFWDRRPKDDGGDA